MKMIVKTNNIHIFKNLEVAIKNVLKFFYLKTQMQTSFGF